MITFQELNARRAWSLEQKIDHTLGVIDQFYNRTNGKVYVGFSGGKDSTVLLHLIRRVFDKNVLGVFCNTGNEYPDIIRFVRSVPNILMVHPELTVRETIGRYGFPLISKEQACYIRQARHSQSESLRYRRLYGERGNLFQNVVSNKWRFLVNAPFEVSEKCCDILKKSRSTFLKEIQVHPQFLAS